MFCVGWQVGLFPDAIQGAAGQHHPPAHSLVRNHWLHDLADGAHKGVLVGVAEGKAPEVCRGEVGVLDSTTLSCADVAQAVPVLGLPPLLSQSGHVPGLKLVRVDMGCSLASRPSRSSLPGDSRLGGAGVVVGGDRVGGDLPGTLNC